VQQRPTEPTIVTPRLRREMIYGTRYKARQFLQFKLEVAMSPHEIDNFVIVVYGEF
jgi:hypothetical protein